MILDYLDLPLPDTRCQESFFEIQRLAPIPSNREIPMQPSPEASVEGAVSYSGKEISNFIVLASLVRDLEGVDAAPITPHREDLQSRRHVMERHEKKCSSKPQ